MNWRPYYLDYNQSPHSVDKSEVANRKLANVSEDKIRAMTARLEQIGRSVGISFKWGGKIGSTRDAHRLIYYTQQVKPECQDALVEGLFHAYHELEEDVSDHVVLRQIALEAGLEGREVDGLLVSDCGGYVVDQEAHLNKAGSRTGVPFFMIQDEHSVDGAQDLMEFLEAFSKVKGETSPR